MIDLSSRQRKILEKNAQPLPALVQVGGAGVTDGQMRHIERLLGEHELVKVKFNDFKEEKSGLSASIAEQTGSTLVRIIGNVATFYRAAKDAKDRKYEKELKNAEK